MRRLIHVGCWLVLGFAVFYVTIGAPDAVLFHNPMAVLGTTLLGLGMCIDAHQREKRIVAEPARRTRGK